MSEIITKIDTTVEKYHMLSRGDTVAIGVSGGADSMLLLNYLLEKAEELDLKLMVANVEHGIRGEASVADSRFVEDYCKSHGVDFKMLSIDAVGGAKAEKLTVEEYARNKRYEFFASLRADKIALAHNLSDNAETVVFRLVRGTSIKGMSGIPAVRDNIIRPLIECTSEEIRTECRRRQIPFVFDETNADNKYTRNYIRNIMMPQLEEINPTAESAIVRLSKSAAEDDAFISKCADECIVNTSVNNGLSVEKLKVYDISVIKRVIMKLLGEFGVTPDEKHIDEALSLLETQKRLLIKNGVFLSSLGGTLRAYRESEGVKSSLQYEVVDIDYFHHNNLQFDFYCDYDKIVGEPFLRKRQEGDKITPVGRGCTKSLKKLLNELKIPAEKRSALSIICDDVGVIAVDTLALDERVCTDGSTKRVILFNITTEE